MTLTTKQKKILEKACKRSSPTIVKKQLANVFGSSIDSNYSDASTASLPLPTQRRLQERTVYNILSDCKFNLYDCQNDLRLCNSSNNNLRHSLIRARTDNGDCTAENNRLRLQYEDAISHIYNLQRERRLFASTPGVAQLLRRRTEDMRIPPQSREPRRRHRYRYYDEFDWNELVVSDVSD